MEIQFCCFQIRLIWFKLRTESWEYAKSVDNGKTWTSVLVLDKGSAVYSDLVGLPDNQVGVLYESKNYGAITFVAFPSSKILHIKQYLIYIIL